MKDKYFTEEFETFCDEMREDSLRNFRNANPEYQELVSENTNMSEKVESFLEGLKEEEQKLINRYIGQMRQISSMELKQLYVQGYRDCIKFLRHIHAFQE